MRREACPQAMDLPLNLSVLTCRKEEEESLSPRAVDKIKGDRAHQTGSECIAHGSCWHWQSALSKILKQTLLIFSLFILPSVLPHLIGQLPSPRRMSAHQVPCNYRIQDSDDISPSPK